MHLCDHREHLAPTPLVTYTCMQDDEEASEVLEILEESEESSSLYLMESEDEDLDTNNNSTGLAPMIILFTPVQLDDTNLPFHADFHSKYLHIQNQCLSTSTPLSNPILLFLLASRTILIGLTKFVPCLLWQDGGAL
jgi:hypothetical protein